MHIPVAGEAPVRTWVWWDLCFSSVKCFYSFSFQLKGGGQLSRSYSSQGGSAPFYKEQLYISSLLFLQLQRRDRESLIPSRGKTDPLCHCSLPHRKECRQMLETPPICQRKLHTNSERNDPALPPPAVKLPFTSLYKIHSGLTLHATHYIAGSNTRRFSRDPGASEGFNIHLLIAGPTLSCSWRIRNFVKASSSTEDQLEEFPCFMENKHLHLHRSANSFYSSISGAF